MWEPRHPSLKVVFDFRPSAATEAFIVKMTASTLNAALGFSVSLWRQIDVLKGLGCLPLYTHHTEPPSEINQMGSWKMGLKEREKD